MKRARELGGDLRLCGLAEDARQTLDVTRLDKQMDVYPTREHAVASWG